MAITVTPAARRLLEEHGLQSPEVPRALSHRLLVSDVLRHLGIESNGAASAASTSAAAGAVGRSTDLDGSSSDEARTDAPSQPPPVASTRQPVEAQPAETQPAEAQPAEAQPAEAQPAAARTARARSCAAFHREGAAASLIGAVLSHCSADEVCGGARNPYSPQPAY